MRYYNITILLVIAAMAFAVTGCSSVDDHRDECASQRWERKINQTRIDVAHERIAQGELAFAELVLQDCADSSTHGQQARQMLAAVQTAQTLDQKIAKTRQQKSLEEQVH
ncbi:MAG: hypothetical protein ACYSUT_03825 [Planctomycetota bacterium]|jgi:hypothetical protein